MKMKKYVQGVTFFTTPTMYEQIKQLTDDKNIGVSEFIRDLIEKYFNSNPVANIAPRNAETSMNSEDEEDSQRNDLH